MKDNVKYRIWRGLGVMGDTRSLAMSAFDWAPTTSNL